jgi:hypothetical protein
MLMSYYPLANEVAKGYSNATVRPSFRPSVRHILVNSRINILQWILTKLGTYLVLKTGGIKEKPSITLCENCNTELRTQMHII